MAKCLNQFLIGFLIAIFAIFGIIGGFLMGFATPPQFPTPQFIAGFVFIMIGFVLAIVTMIIVKIEVENRIDAPQPR